METRELICIGCPLGCNLTVTIDGSEVNVTGNTCQRGADYGKKEVTDPTRILTASVKINGGVVARLPVKTSRDIKKGMIMEIMEKVHACSVEAPVHIGDVIIKDICGSGADLISARDVDRV
ncbi:DUF1667 domain-containing protein [Butyrivibrio sp. MC2013]|uniref:DUF1667 domain-containing protein n=1 Tax=Butyrivibrio sp. MC2013 TaxID=1280686 RepID=UPI00040F4D64|nr:DUF1667 domain-containing protein [Butyrivibrio sp. MC2013]